MSTFIGEIKKVVIEEGKQVAQVTMFIPRKEATKIDMGNVEVTVKATQQKMFGTDDKK